MYVGHACLDSGLIVYEVNNLLFVRFPIERLFSQTRGRVLFAFANNLGNALVNNHLFVRFSLRNALANFIENQTFFSVQAIVIH
jgi:hypothetical protein